MQAQKRNATFPKDAYWFATDDHDDLIGYLTTKIRDYYDFLQRSGLFFVMQRAHNAYFGGRLDGSNQTELFAASALGRGGRQGELVFAQTNHFANVLDHTVQLTTSTKPAFQGRATNSDSKSMSQAILATSITDYYWAFQGLSGKYVQGVANSLRHGEAAIHRPWDKAAGSAYVADPETGTVRKEGDLKFDVLTPLDVIRETARECRDWYVVRSKVNRWDLVARNPKLKDKLQSVPSASSDQFADYADFMQFRGAQKDDDSVYVWTAYHAKTDAMTKGRLFVFCGDVPLYDGPIPYEAIPIDFIRPRTLQSTNCGFSPMWALLGVQQILDILTSTIVTNQSTNGTNNLWTKANDPIAVASLPGGMKNLMSETKPEVIQLVATAPEIFNFRQQMIAEMETLSGINSTVRGNPEASLKSGNALALIVAQATSFAGMLEASLQEAQEATATGIIVSLRSFSKSKRVANIVGQANRPLRREFTPDQDLAAVQRVVIEPVNPLSKTISGRLELAQNLLQQGLIKTAQQYLTVLQTGQLDPALESSGSSEMLNIRAEGENLRDGKPVVAIISDQHLTHIREHLALLAMPEVREDAAFVQRVLDHVKEHEALWAQLGMRPALMLATDQQPPPQGPPQNPPAAPQSNAQVMQQPPGPGEGNLPGMPSLPSLPDNAPPQSQEAYAKAVTQ